MDLPSTQHSGTVFGRNHGEIVIADHDASGKEWIVPIRIADSDTRARLQIGDRVKFSVTARQAHSFRLME
jgi:hypothetical protein